MIGAKTGVEVIKILQAPNHERRARKQDNGERDFADHKGIAQAVASRANAAPAAALLQRVSELKLRKKTQVE